MSVNKFITEPIKDKAMKMTHKALGEDISAESNIFKLVLGVFIVAILASALIPTAINSLVTGSNGSGAWDAGTTATYDSMPILIVICIVAVLAGIAYRAFND